MKVYYSEATNSVVIDFLMKNKTWLECIEVKEADRWIVGILDNEVISAVGIKSFAKTDRISTIYVSKENRRKGIGTQTVMKAIENNKKRITVFATPHCSEMLMKLRFKVIRQNANNDDYFMEREEIRDVH